MLRQSRLRFLRWLAATGGASVYARGDSPTVAWLVARGYIGRDGYQVWLTDKGRIEMARGPV